MSGSCESGSCETESRSQECSSSGGKGCGCGSAGCSGDPVDCATGMWTCAFFTAMKQAQVEILKTKMQKAWGAKMDKAADAVLEAMGTQWQAMLAQAGAKAQLRQRLAGLWQEGK